MPDLSGPVLGSALTLVAYGGVWVARQFVREQKDAPKPSVSPDELKDALKHTVSPIQLEAALFKFGGEQLDRTNGRYPSREVFNGAIQSLTDKIDQVREDISGVQEKIDALIAIKLASSAAARKASVRLKAL